MDSIEENISMVAGSLGDIVVQSENDFIRLGQRLQSIHGEIVTLTDRTDTSARLMQGDDGNMLVNIKAVAASAIDNLLKSQKTIQKNIAPLPRIIGCIEELRSTQGGIDRIAKYLKAVAFNFIIETSKSKHQDGNFNILANEIKGLSDQISEISARIKNDTGQVYSDLTGADKILSKGLQELISLTSNAGSSVESSLQKTEELIEVSFSTIENVKEVSTSINHQIANIIISMQMHDNISQRIFHINQGLEDVRILTHTDKAIGNREYSREERLGLAHSILLLEVSQLEQIIKDIENAYKDNFSAFEYIKSEIIGFTQNIQKTKATKGKSSLIFDLSASLMQLDTIRNQGISVIDRLQEVSLKSSKTGERLSNHVSLVRYMGDESHHKALNAIVAAHKLDAKGTTFKVLANELRDMTDQIVGFVNTVGNILGKITSAALDIKESSKVRFTEEESDTKTIETAVSGITGLYETVNNNLGDALDHGKGLKESIEQVICELSFLENMVESLSSPLTELEKLKTYFKERTDTFETSFIDDPYFSERYTMEKERNIHRQSLGQTRGEETDISPDQNDYDELENNIELF